MTAGSQACGTWYFGQEQGVEGKGEQAADEMNGLEGKGRERERVLQKSFGGDDVL